MAYDFNYESIRFRRKLSVIFLALFWILGIALGIVYAAVCRSHVASLMRGFLSGTVSIVGLLCVSVIPFLFSAFAVLISKPRILFLVAFGKGFFFSFVSCGFLFSLGSAGWLFRLLLMFSDLVSMPVLFWYWQRHISGEACFSAVQSLFVASLLILIGSIDFCCVSPFLALLINS